MKKFGAAVILQRQSTLEKWQDRIQYLGTNERSFRHVAKQIDKRRA